jgi:hypothetical protein
MSVLATNAITDASGGNTATINGQTPTVSNMAGRNRIINGDMRIDQRNAGASISLGGSIVFPVDRFGSQTNVGSGHTLEQVEDAPAGFIQSLKLTVGTGATPTGTNFGRLRQLVEANNTADFNFGTSNAKTITVSFWVKSSITGTFGLSVFNNANDRSYVSTYTVSSANTWEQKTITVVGDTSGTWTTDNSAGVSIAWDLGEGPDRSKAAGSWGATVGSGYGLTGGTKILATTGATWQITGVQLEAGSVATPFEHVDYGEMLRRCQRYYYKLEGAAQSPYGVCTGQSSTRAIAFINFPVPMRTAPTALEQSGTASHYYIRLAAVDVVCNAVPTIQDRCNVISAMANVYVASGLSTGYAAIAGSNDTSGYLGWSAEL